MAAAELLCPLLSFPSYSKTIGKRRKLFMAFSVFTDLSID